MKGEGENSKGVTFKIKGDSGSNIRKAKRNDKSIPKAKIKIFKATLLNNVA